MNPHEPSKPGLQSGILSQKQKKEKNKKQKTIRLPRGKISPERAAPQVERCYQANVRK